MARSLVVPLGGLPDPEGAMAAACALAGQEGRVDAVVVIEVSPLLPLDARMNREEASARVLLARARAVADASGARFVPHVLRAREAVSAILDLAEQVDGDVVVADGDGRRLGRAERKLLRKAGDRALVVAA